MSIFGVQTKKPKNYMTVTKEFNGFIGNTSSFFYEKFCYDKYNISKFSGDTPNNGYCPTIDVKVI